MAAATAEFTPDSPRTVDDLFQFLTRVRGIPAADAIAQATDFLKRDRLRINLRIHGGPAQRMSFQTWTSGMLYLRLDGDRLVVAPLQALQHPWEAYSFEVSDWSLVCDLWPGEDRDKAGIPSQSDQDKATQIAGAYGPLFEQGALRGLRGKALREVVYKAIGPKFTAARSTFQESVRRYRERHDRHL